MQREAGKRTGDSIPPAFPLRFAGMERGGQLCLVESCDNRARSEPTKENVLRSTSSARGTCILPQSPEPTGAPQRWPPLCRPCHYPYYWSYPYYPTPLPGEGNTPFHSQPRSCSPRASPRFFWPRCSILGWETPDMEEREGSEWVGGFQTLFPQL